MKSILAAAIFLLVPQIAAADTMPQLDFANPMTVWQIAWGALIFLLFYLALSRFGLPKVGAVLQMRADTIRAELEQAAAAKSHADAAVAELNEARASSYAAAQAEVNAATLAGKTEAAEQAAVQNARLDAQLVQSEARIADARTQALAGLPEIAEQAAHAVLAALIHQPGSEYPVHEAVRQILAEHPSRLKAA